MGYDVHITRKEDWSDPDGPLISEEEWRKVIEDDPELTLDTDSKCVMTDGEYVFATWNQQVGVFGFYNGEITSKNPDHTTIRKMVEIAHRLNASVMGDDFERYPEHFEVIAKQKLNWWQRLFGPK